MPADRTPARCPTCPSTDPKVRGTVWAKEHPIYGPGRNGVFFDCRDPFHDQPAEPFVPDKEQAETYAFVSDRSPAQVAEDEERETQFQMGFVCTCDIEPCPHWKQHVAHITRALAARARAQHVEDCDTIKYGACPNCDRLRRAYESLKEGK